ncbi:LysM peptidoglycan-binding domain-containing protein, partial [Protofrankia symbiont of Coriaria ruscifolia]|uniref:LysM peptidoglycan-binding domain-containing protein n=1 Tax=Protofrankia symbiont of Coriaria ruscifolia TaxID=1306542 RepID=UPI0013EF9D06
MSAVRRLLVFLAGAVAATTLTIIMVEVGPGRADLPSGLSAVPDWVEADPEHALTTVVGLAAWACLLWLCVGFILGALAALPGIGGRAAATVARRILPRALRHIVEVALGITLAAGTAAPALAVSPTAVTGPATVTAAVSSTAWPDVDPYDPSPPSAIPAGTPGSSIRSSSPEPTGSPADVLATTPSPANPTNPASSPVRSVPAPTPVMSMSPGVQAPWPDPSPGSRVQDSSMVVVLRGDTLWTIAARHLGADATAEQIAQEWPRWWAANKHVIGSDPDRILPGQHLQPPHPR